MGSIETGRSVFRRVVYYSQRLRRFSFQHPLVTLTILLFLGLSYGIHYFHYLCHTGMGRWYYNYAVTQTPASLVRFIPLGDHSSGPTHHPIWVPEIFESTWMGDWEVPELTKPVWREEEFRQDQTGVVEEVNGQVGPDLAEGQRLKDLDSTTPPVLRRDSNQKQHDPLPTAHPHTLSRRLSSPAIIKFHVYSTATQEKSRVKRDLIRRLSPIYQVPPEYRHLIDVKFVLGYNYLDTWGLPLNETTESKIREEEREFGDILRLPGLWRGENLRDGKLPQWIRDVGQGKDGRDAWYLFKVDDDTVVNMPKFLDLLMSLDVHQPLYLGTSLNRWPDYHNHFTGMLTGFNYGVYKTLSEGISKMKIKDVQQAWDDDVLTGELMYTLPSAPHCQGLNTTKCNPHSTPKYGWMPNPTNPDPRTNLNRYDFIRRAGDPDWYWTKGDLAKHGWWLKWPEYWEKEWKKVCEPVMWKPPRWLEKCADKSI